VTLLQRRIMALLASHKPVSASLVYRLLQRDGFTFDQIKHARARLKRVVTIGATNAAHWRWLDTDELHPSEKPPPAPKGPPVCQHCGVRTANGPTCWRCELRASGEIEPCAERATSRGG
jgi:hypothetical protein